jgi:hypothetical protein
MLALEPIRWPVRDTCPVSCKAQLGLNFATPLMMSTFYIASSAGSKGHLLDADRKGKFRRANVLT